MIDVAASSLAVHALLVAGSDSVTAVVARPARDPDHITGMETVANARVRVVHGAATVALSERRNCLYAPNVDPRVPATSDCYTGRVPGGIRAGGVYELLVEVAGQGPIHGTTRVPFAPQIVEPDSSAEPPLLRVADHGREPTPLKVRWTRSTVAENAVMELRFAVTDCYVPVSWPEHTDPHDYVRVIGTDTASVAAIELQCDDGFVERRSGRLVVTVYDANYTHYWTAPDYRTSYRPSHASAGITGAFGVFGAAASSATPVVVTVF